MNKMSNTTDKEEYEKEIEKYINVYENVIKKKGIYNYKIILDKLRNDMKKYAVKKTQLGNNLVIVINGLITDIKKNKLKKKKKKNI
jgi:L-rhamnose mutarotase